MKNFLVSILCALTMIARGQQAVVVTGGDASGVGGSVSYSIGQVAYTNDTGGFVNSGVQQPFEITITSVDDSFRDLQLNLFPNPASQELFIEMKNTNKGISAEVLNSTGSLMDTIRLASTRTSIPVSHWAPATYMIRLTDESGNTAVYKVIKH
jgi:hypothetical protein